MPSTVVASIRYDTATLTLWVEFVSGSIYKYSNVEEKVYWDLKKSGSKGTFLNQQIKGNYEYKKIK